MERAVTELIDLLKHKNESFEYNLHDFIDHVGLNNVMPPGEAFNFLKYLVGHKWLIWRLEREWQVSKPTNYVYGEMTFMIKREGHKGSTLHPTKERTFRKGRENQKRSFNR